MPAGLQFADAEMRAGSPHPGVYTFRRSQIWENMPKMGRKSLQIASSALWIGLSALNSPIAAFPGALPQASIGRASGPLPVKSWTERRPEQ